MSLNLRDGVFLVPLNRKAEDWTGGKVYFGADCAEHRDGQTFYLQMPSHLVALDIAKRTAPDAFETADGRRFQAVQANLWWYERYKDQLSPQITKTIRTDKDIIALANSALFGW